MASVTYRGSISEDDPRYKEGYKISGEWRFGELTRGTAIWPNGNKYEGEFKNWN